MCSDRPGSAGLLLRYRRCASHRTTATAQVVAEELRGEHEFSFGLLQFPEDFVARPNEGDLFNLPPGAVEVSEAMRDTGGLLSAGTIRVDGKDGDVIDVDSVARASFLEALSLCHRTGQIRLPDDEMCNDAVSNFDQYRAELQYTYLRLARESRPISADRRMSPTH